MKTISLLLIVALSVPAFAQCDETAPEGTSCGKPDPSDAPLLFEADGKTLQKGRSIKMEEGTTAPFRGRLLDTQEQVRRERINERNAVELKTLKQGNVIVATPTFIVILVGVVAASAAISVGVVKATEKK